MSRFQWLVVGIALVAVIYGSFSGVGYERPAYAASRLNLAPMTTTKFESLFDMGKTFQSLTEPGVYTVVEGYLTTCGICKKLEAGFPSFLGHRRDVIIRQVQFSASGGVRFDGSNPEEYEQQVRDYGQKLAHYASFDIDISNGQLHIGTCGTPHVEIYGPDQKLLIGDSCQDGHKNGLGFLRHWMSDEQ